MSTPVPRPPSDYRRPGLGVLMWIVACLAFAFAVASKHASDGRIDWFVLITLILGGLSLAGPPILLLERRRRRRTWGRARPFGPGQLLWFSTGTASWLLWPPIVVRTISGSSDQILGRGMSTVCFVYGTPLMALYVTIALLGGGHFRLGRRRRDRNPYQRRRRARRSWTETAGLILGLLWATSGLYFLAMIYAEDLRLARFFR